VEAGRIEAYLATPRLRRLIAVVEQGGQIFPLPLDVPSDVAIMLASTGPARTRLATEADRSAAIHWGKLRGGMVVPEAQDAVMGAVQQFNRSLEDCLAAEANQADRDLIERQKGGAATLAEEEGIAAELDWVAETMHWRIAGDAVPPLAGLDTGGLAAAIRRAGLRGRRVTLEPDWAARSGEPMLVKLGEEIRAAIWHKGCWRLRSGELLTGEGAADARTAWTLHATFSALGRAPSGFRAMARFLFPDMLRATPRLALTSLVIALIGLAYPIAVGAYFDHIIPDGEAGQILSLGIALATSALFSALFAALRGRVLLAVEGQGSLRLAAALGDHVLRLPETAFREYSAGDFNQRLENIEEIRRLVANLFGSALLTALAALAYFILMFWYDVALAALGAAMSLVSLGLLWIGRTIQSRPLDEAAPLAGELAGRTYELLESVAKLRTSAAEGRVLARWRRLYAREQAIRARSGAVAGSTVSVTEAYSVLTLIVFYGAIIWTSIDLSPGQLLAFLSAFAIFQTALNELGTEMLTLLAARSLVRRGEAILSLAPESSANAVDPGPLSGAIEMSQIVFGYNARSAPLLDGLSLRVAPGEHVAIVGGSGSGKSTTLRLLLGFECPAAGSITYDGQELGQLDVMRVRSQIGVVLQSSTLFSGSILDNIRGASDASLERCLDAAGEAGLAADLRHMPLGIHTLVTEGGGTFSGGQRQRILIARALVSRPKILFFDEATSALDNETQSVVAKTLDALSVTRITIAHRLSTVRNADRILLLQGGRFIEEGRFDDLMSQNGIFTALAERQLVKD
jgi:ATP-binding cassette subfamily C protein